MTEQQKHAAPSEELVRTVLKDRLPAVGSVRRAPEGVSTYVYRVEAGSRICYARFLPEEATFGVEVLAHRLARQAGVPVPEVLLYLPREPLTGLSLMAVSQIPGRSSVNGLAGEELSGVLRQAGAALARLHTVPAEGFGWIDRTREDRLWGEHPAFAGYFTEFLEEDLAALSLYGMALSQREQTRDLMEEALEALDTDWAVLVHGDFCLEHIFQEGGRFTGIIDLGEIRGNTPFFDLGTFALNDPTPGRAATAALLAGYEKVRPLGEYSLRRIDLAALAFALRFCGRKAGSGAGPYWLNKLEGQLSRLEKRENY